VAPEAAPRALGSEPGSGAARAGPAGGAAFTVSVDDAGLAEVVFDRPGQSVNTLDTAVMAELEALVEELARDPRITVAAFYSDKEKGFVAGADIREIEGVHEVEDGRRKVVRGQKIFQRLAALPFPTLAVIHGACLGGGLEFALACRHRIAALDAELGLPEVNLGILPAWGGTQRLSRLVGPLAAVDLVCTGKRVDGKQALRLGLVDRASPPRELRARARAFARDLVEAGKRAADRLDGGPGGARRGAKGLRGLALEGNPVGRKLLFGQARKKILARTGGHYPAPLRALQAIEEGLQGSLEAGLALEARLVSDLLVSPASKNLIHVFNLFESVKKSRYAEAPPGVRPLERAAVVGAGVMGGGIAQLLALAGLSVRLKDLETSRVAEGLRAARGLFETRRRRRKLDRAGLRRHMNLIAGTTGYEGFGRADLVIEAIVEDLEAKRAVFAELDARVPAAALLCSNTSSLPIGELASVVRDPSRVAGLHFFNPVDRMPLVEVVRGAATAEETVGALYRLALRLRKKPVVVKDSPGFLVNRILMPYLNEAAHLFGNGVEAEAIDRAMTAFGMPVGPLALLDDIGLDVATHVGRVLDAAFPGRMDPAPLFESLHALGRRGRKGGRGFYLYEGGSRKGADRSLRRDLAAAGSVMRDDSLASRSAPLVGRADVPTADRAMVGGGLADPVEIERRLIYPMVDEAALCLAEGVVGSAAELDLAMIAGTGFPPFRGGLLRHADAVGVQGVVSVLERLSSVVGPRLAPSAALREVAARGGFYANPTAGGPPGGAGGG
jgi:3-hydroxyacyl-CoA dehydrogenase/enoyl-CoA hydratase/3-hydroxybutyryl-CoA epimerase